MKCRFNLAHIIPEKVYFPQAYAEIIETVGWGLSQLGHEVTYSTNSCSSGVTNIVVGAQMLEPHSLEALPRDSIVYNLEQLAGATPAEIRPSNHYCARHFLVWDYSEYNLPTWKAVNPDIRLKWLPVGYAPILQRIEKPPLQDIEVLFYGATGGERLRIFAELCAKFVKAVFVHGLYGASRDSLIARSKIVLNINQYPATRIFEIARVSYLLANRKAVISDWSPLSKVEAGFENAVLFAPVDDIVDECLRLLANEDERCSLEDAGFRTISQRDIRELLIPALPGADG